MASRDTDVRTRWPLHYHVWMGDSMGLERYLKSPSLSPEGIELQDPRGNTPLMLAVMLGEVAHVKILLNHGARANVTNKNGWSALHEATARANADLVSEVLTYRDHQVSEEQKQLIPQLLQTLSKAADFYVEMKWEFTSWVPFVSRVCPSDTYKVWKAGKSIRVDSTLTGFENMSWERGHISLIFNLDDTCVQSIQIDHESQTAFADEINLPNPNNGVVHSNAPYPASQAEVSRRLKLPLSSTLLNTGEIDFIRNRQGIIFRSDKTEVVNGLEARVYSVSGVQLVTRQRTEHLPERVKKQMKQSFNPLQNILGFMGQQADISGGNPEAEPIEYLPNEQTDPDGEYPPITSSLKPTLEEYFYPQLDKNGKPKEIQIGNIPEINEKVQKFKGTVWLADDFPLNVEEHVLPVIELISLNLPHFSKLKEFLAMKIPAGFPIKLELPLYHVMVARVTFQNFNGCDSSVPVPYVTVESVPVGVQCEYMGGRGGQDEGSSELRQRRGDREPEERADVPLLEMETGASIPTRKMHMCTVDPLCFKIPYGYRGSRQEMLGSTLGGGYQDDEDAMIQMAIRQSMAESKKYDGKEFEQSYQGHMDNFIDLDNDQLQQALRESLAYNQLQTSLPHQGPYSPISSSLTAPSLSSATPSSIPHTNEYKMTSLSDEQQVELALQMSRENYTTPTPKPLSQLSPEDEELERVLKLSLTDK